MFELQGAIGSGRAGLYFLQLLPQHLDLFAGVSSRVFDRLQHRSDLMDFDFQTTAPD